MRWGGGNKAIRDHGQNGRILLVFETVKDGRRRFTGPMSYVGHYEKTLPDKNGNPRKAIVFKLAKSETSSAEDPEGPEARDALGYEASRLAALISGTNLFAGSENGLVYISRDNGDTWSAVSVGLPRDASVRSLAVVGADLFAGTSKGIFLSTDNGANWAPRNSGLPKNLDDMEITDMDFSNQIEAMDWFNENLRSITSKVKLKRIAPKQIH